MRVANIRAVQTPVSKPALSGPSATTLASSSFWPLFNFGCFPGYGPLINECRPSVRYFSIHDSSVRRGTPSISLASLWGMPSATRRMQVILRSRSWIRFFLAKSRSWLSVPRSSRVSNSPLMPIARHLWFFDDFQYHHSTLKSTMNTPAIFKQENYSRKRKLSGEDLLNLDRVGPVTSRPSTSRQPFRH